MRKKWKMGEVNVKQSKIFDTLTVIEMNQDRIAPINILATIPLDVNKNK